MAMAAAARAYGFLVAVMNIKHLAKLQSKICVRHVHPKRDSVAGQIDSEKIYQEYTMYIPGI